MGERVLATAHAPSIRPRDLLLVDQGYLAFWFFAWILSLSTHFCDRVNLTYALNAMRTLLVPLISTESYSKLYGLLKELISRLAS